MQQTGGINHVIGETKVRKNIIKDPEWEAVELQRCANPFCNKILRTRTCIISDSGYVLCSVVCAREDGQQTAAYDTNGDFLFGKYNTNCCICGKHVAPVDMIFSTFNWITCNNRCYVEEENLEEHLKGRRYKERQGWKNY